MSSALTNAVAGRWPADVLEYAARNQVDGYLDPFLEATRHLFPTARSVRVSLEEDAELSGVRWIVFEVEVAVADVADYVAAKKSWNQELARFCPAPNAHHFCLDLQRVER